MALEEVTSLVNDSLFAVWFLIGAALVFWMQAGFAMVFKARLQWLKRALQDRKIPETL